jgi:hypothetical protein
MKSNASTFRKIGWMVFTIAAIYLFGFLSVNGGKQ